MEDLAKDIGAQAPAVFALVWAIRFMGEKIDRLVAAIQELRVEVKEGRCKAVEN